MQQNQGSISRIQVFQQQKNEPNEEDLPFLSLFRFADRFDIILMTIGSIASIGAGCISPLLTFLLTNFNVPLTSHDADYQKSKGAEALLGFVYLAIGGLICTWVMTTFWFIAGQRQASKCRMAYYGSLLKQDIQFYDCSQQSQLNSKFSIDTLNFQGSIGQKMALVLQIIGSFICMIVIAFTQGWLFTIVIISTIPLLILATYFNLTTFQGKEKKFLQTYSKAGGKIEETISSIKTVKQFSAEDYSLQFYIQKLKETSKNKFQTILKIALSFGILNGFIFIIYSLGFWFGANCVIGSDHCPTNISGKYYTTQNVQVPLFTLVMSCNLLTGFTPALKKISLGRQASKRIFKAIDRVPKININSDGLQFDTFEGKVEFRNVTFAYPKDKSKKILQNISIVFDLQSSALVGESGCGKSTITQLLLRFYDPDEGEILIDGHSLKDYNLNWLRKQIGYVGQQPVLFAASIKENLLFANSQATEEDMKAALMQAEVYDFVYGHLENKLDTYVGIGGSQISGGQKQRIAIARALIKKPKILILDEATSALDRTNELLIQKTLNNISKKLTTITIAHRIGTIINCNKIFVLGNGTVLQSGKFEEIGRFRNEKYLMQINSAQNMDEENEGNKKIKQKQHKIQENIEIKDDEYIKKEQQRLKNQKSIQSYNNSGINGRILSYCKKKKLALIIAIILSCALGVVYPLFSMYVGKIVSSMLNLQSNRNDQNSKNNINISSLSFLLIGIGAFLLYFAQNILGYVAGEQIVASLREETFKKILKMPMKWFDLRENTSGSLSHRLSHSCEIISELVTTNIFILVQTFASIICGFIISFVYEWRMTLAEIGLFPLIVISGVMRTRSKTKITQTTEEVHKKTSGIISQSLINIRTVYALNMEEIISRKYKESLEQPYTQLVKTAIFSGFMNGLGSIGVTLFCGILLYIGVIIIIYTGSTLESITTVFFMYLFTGMSAVNNLNFMPDIAHAKISAVGLFEIIDSQDEQQMQVRQKSQMISQGFNCNINFEKVSFKYDGRQQYVLQDLSLHIKQGQKIALVGPSGCGKSTIMQILLRFYQVESGNILINSINIKDFDIKYLRRQFGVVSQEPVVFNTDFRENIRYNTLNASEEDIRMAAKYANALQFIEGKEELCQQGLDSRQMSKGFDRVVGLKGLHISGGQKQRLAIARAILKNPRILLLDEATSALDSENQRIVQDSLNRIMDGRTTITVAHRIKTIENSDIIYMINKGAMVEQGTYEQLIKTQGAFYQLERGGKID